MNASSSSSSYHESFHGHQLYHRILIFVFLCCCLTNVTDSMPYDNNYNNGNRERRQRFQNFYKFMGFRFEIRALSSHLHFEDDDDVHSLGKKIIMRLKEMADESFCFGWAQQTLRGAVVGEVRCHEIAGYNFQKFLLKGGLETSILDGSTRSSNSEGGTFPTMKLLETVIHVYKDTKIKLHFSHFKILDMDRNTCFRDEPHQCPDEDMVVTLF